MLHYLSIDGHRLAYLPLGADQPGEPTILIHGISHSIFFWARDPVFRRYGPCYSLSLPDHFPAVGVSTDRPLSVERITDLLISAISTITAGCPANLVGISTGGFAVLAIAARAPELARRVVCISGFARGRWTGSIGLLQRLARGGAPGHALFRAFTYYTLRSPTTARAAFRLMWRTATPRLSMDAFAGYPYIEEVAAAMLPMAYHLDDAAMIAAFGAFPDIDITSWLPKISAPTLVVYGERDPIVPPAQACIIAEHVRSSDRLPIPGAGHLPNFEDFARFQAGVDAWWKRV